MKKKLLTNMIAAVLVVSMVGSLTGCAGKVQATNLMEGVSAKNVTREVDLDAHSSELTDFAVRLLNTTQKLSDGEKGENILLSPVSVLNALSMTANGAKEETLTQMENVLGMDIGSLNDYLYHYMQALPQGETYKLHVANSIWFTDEESFTVEKDFLQMNADYYGADIYQAPFNQTTLKDINQWVNEKTDEMIPEILDEIPDDAVMYLVNALAFDAEWLRIYETSDIRDGVFTNENGAEETVEFMYSNETKYLKDEHAQGFVKYYDDVKYAFVALLPDDDTSVSGYLESLDGEHLQNMIGNAQNTNVDAAIPKFEIEYDVEMSDILTEMGMPDAFDSDLADFSGLGSSTKGNIVINRVLHKTYISVDEKGTKAGAATAVEMKQECAAEEPPDVKVVHLDRPFVYMLIDSETNIPFFIGTVTNLSK